MKKNHYLSKTIYPLEWLDETVNLLSDTVKDRDEYQDSILSLLDGETEKLKKLLNGLAFSTLKKRKIKRLLRHYHATLSLFHRQLLLFRDTQERHAVAVHEHISSLIAFMEVRFPGYLKKPKGTADKSKGHNPFKLHCILSVDQLAIILKSADDLRIIISRSLSNIFNQLAPYLSTPYKENLSPESMRSHTYSIEERDKQIAIETLQKMIEKIQEY